MKNLFNTHNLGLKILAVLLAFLLWVYLYLIQPGRLPFGILPRP